MLSSQQNVDAITRLAEEFKAFAKLKARSLQLSSVEKLTIILSAILTGAILLLLCSFALIWFTAAVCAWLAPHLGGIAVALALAGCFYALLAIIVILRRKAWIINPICNFLANIFISEEGTLSDAEEGLE